MGTNFGVRVFTLIMLSVSALIGCEGEPPATQVAIGSQGNTPPTPSTVAINQAVAESLDLTNPQDFDNATKGLIARADGLRVSMADGSMVWSLNDYDFIHGDAPDSVNPSLWRQERLNNIHGLFEVTQGVYQLRGFDLSNMSIIEGERGWILVDPLTTKETAAAALAFARQKLGDRPVTAVIITHSHIDHFGGVLAVLEGNGETEIIAPQGFMSEATSENVIAGTTMSRRSMFMYGSQL
jgi:alkyl sulfatase BDS1-like metallo-beta-lactamase superfamily hydrolase